MDIKELVKLVKKRNVFITGGGGTGKSWSIARLSEHLPLVITSSTGISAVNINGQTIHSWAGIGIADRTINEVIENLNQKKNWVRKNEILKAEYLVIDEVSMLNSYVFDYTSEVLKRIRENDKPFGGLRVICTGDFFQLPPVKINETVEINKAQRLIDYCFNSLAWKELDFEIINLTHVYRQNDKDFVETLNRIRYGKMNNNDQKMLEKRNFPASYEIPEEAVKLYGTNAEADKENMKRFNELDGKAYTYIANDKIRSYIDGRSQMVSPDNPKLQPWDKQKYDQFNEDCRVPQKLVLKEGARVMLLHNTDVSNGLANGACGYVKRLTDYGITVAFDNGVTTSIGEETIELRQGDKVKISRTQYPLRLAYACTIHKSQGLTFDKVFADFNRIFAAGQAYVALSRVTSLDGLYLKGFSPNKVFADETVKKFYHEVVK